MKRIFSSSLLALAAGLGLRLFFVLKFPANSGDAILYEQIAANWLKHGVYAMDVAGKITPVDIRMPGYPAVLAIIYALSGKVGEAARLYVMLAQVAVDLFTCLVVASLAAMILLLLDEQARPKRVFCTALWLAALCPFTANYTAVPLTEVFAILFTALALIPLSMLAGRAAEGGFLIVKEHWILGNEYWYLAGIGGFLVGVGTLFRPETPLLLIVAWIVLGVLLIPQRETLRWIKTILLTGLLCGVPLMPWAIRNAITLHEAQFLAPKNSNLPGELVPFGFMAWEKTWLYRVRDVYNISWKLNDDVINLEDIPASAFDTPQEKERVAAILEQYNDEVTLTPEEDAAFTQLAKERTARYPLRTYLRLPAMRAVRMWFTPRIELLPVSGHVFPLAYMFEEDPVDQRVTSGLFLLNIVYLAMGLWGALRVWRQRVARPAVALLITFILLRTAFLTTLETPEPRYVLVCFPAIIAMAAQIFARRAAVPKAALAQAFRTEAL